MLVSITLIIALLLDALLGEPRRWHPLVGFGNLAIQLEKKLNRPRVLSPVALRLAGITAWLIIVLPFVSAAYYWQQYAAAYQYEVSSTMVIGLDFVTAILFLTLAIGTKSLVEHAKAVSDALKNNDIELARKNTALIVSRDTSDSDELALNKAAVESVLENGSDAIFAAIFWFILLGVPGVVLYRLANTLDAMWGYRSERYLYFGWAAARLDDGLNWLPARLTALSYAVAGNTVQAVSCWRKQAKLWCGTNPGVVMASGAGALSVKLGGTAIYHGQSTNRPVLGCHNEAKTGDIDRAIALVYKSIYIWLLIIVIGNYFIV